MTWRFAFANNLCFASITAEGTCPFIDFYNERVLHPLRCCVYAREMLGKVCVQAMRLQRCCLFSAMFANAGTAARRCSSPDLACASCITVGFDLKLMNRRASFLGKYTSIRLITACVGKHENRIREELARAGNATRTYFREVRVIAFFARF